ncbi:MAG: selenocysteine-specific translation elongation factor [Chloroflexota bacterium]
MKVIGTAGHIDHGKSTLVQRLTGIDPDRLAEEKRRGMTIDLGFAWLSLPSGAEASIVDVPGHDRFIKNMLAGVGGIDLALLVVAADEGIMPQTTEHLAILDLLGVRNGVVALTKADTVEPDWLGLIEADIHQALSESTLVGSPVVAVDALSGRGVDSLLTQLDESLGQVPDRVDYGLPYLPIDRVFSLPGFGTIVTGTLNGGSLSAGEDVEILPSGRRARIRGLQTHRQGVEQAQPGTRVAANLSGIDREQLTRGMVLAAPDSLRAVRRFAASVRSLPTAPLLSSGLELALHIGSAERRTTVRLLDPDGLQPGGRGWTHLSLDEPVAGIRGQRFILRLPAPLGTVAGGQVVDLSPRRRSSAHRRLEMMASDEPHVALLAAIEGTKPVQPRRLARLLSWSLSRTEQALAELQARAQVRRLGPGFMLDSAWSGTASRAAQALAAYHGAHPLRTGMSAEELRSKLGWPAMYWSSALEALAEDNVLRRNGTFVAAPSFAGGTEGRQADVERLRDLLGNQPFGPPSGIDLIRQAGDSAELLPVLAESGEIVRLADGLYLTSEAYKEAIELVRTKLVRDGAITVAQVRDSLGTSRKYALALLEHLDAQRLTRRQGDERVAGTRFAE